MTVTVAGITEVLRTDASDPFTFSNDQGTTSPQGVLIGIVKTGSITDHISNVTYGGVALSRVRRDTADSGEAGACEWWFRGDSIPTGTQTVSLGTAATGNDMLIVCITLDGAGDLEIVDSDGISTTAVQADPSITLQYTGRTSMAFAAHYSGLSLHSSITAGTNTEKVSTLELAGNTTGVITRQSTAGSSDFTIGNTSASDDLAFSALAVSEAAAAPKSFLFPHQPAALLPLLTM